MQCMYYIPIVMPDIRSSFSSHSPKARLYMRAMPWRLPTNANVLCIYSFVIKQEHVSDSPIFLDWKEDFLLTAN